MGASFIVSIDTELRWGYRFYPTAKLARVLQDHEEKAISSIGSFLDLFEKYSIPATWAVVGKLFYKHPELVANIRESGIEHEIGYHSFSHIRFSQVSRAAAERELKEGLEIQDEFGVKFRSFVFPENMIGHVDLLAEYGYSVYRGPNNAGASVNKSLPIRAKNFALFRIVAPPVEPRWKETIWELPSSMQFHDISVFQTLITFKAKRGIKKAMEAGCAFHIFLHPENALIDPKLLNRLENVLQFVKTEAEKKELRPITMGDFAEVITRNHSVKGTTDNGPRFD